MDPGSDVAVESHVADQAAFISSLRKRLEASEDKEAVTTSTVPQPTQIPAVAVADVPGDEQSWEPSESLADVDNATRQSVHVRSYCTVLRMDRLKSGGWGGHSRVSVHCI